MSNAETATTPAPRAKASERLFIDANGNEVDRIEQATGARYKIPANGRSFDMQLGEAGKPETMFAVFGYHTKLGNVANTIRNDKTEPGTPDDEADTLEEFVAGVAGGLWREPSEAGPRGPKYDDAVLAAVIHAAFTAKGTAKGDEAHYLVRLADKAYRAKVLAAAFDGTSVKDLYAAEAQRRGITTKATPRELDDLA